MRRRCPESRAGDTSAMYIGAPTEVSPIPQPTRNRPAINVGTLLATTQRSDAAAKIRPAAMLVRRRPPRSASTPAIRAAAKRPDGHRADDQPLGSRLDREVLPDVEDRPRDDTRIVAEQPAADRRDDRDHGDEGGHFTLGFRRACRSSWWARDLLCLLARRRPPSTPLVCRVGRCSGQRRLYQIGPNESGATIATPATAALSETRITSPVKPPEAGPWYSGGGGRPVGLLPARRRLVTSDEASTRRSPTGSGLGDKIVDITYPYRPSALFRSGRTRHGGCERSSIVRRTAARPMKPCAGAVMTAGSTATAGGRWL